MLNWLSGLLGLGALGATDIPDLIVNGVHVPVGGMVAAAITLLAHILPAPVKAVVGKKV